MKQQQTCATAMCLKEALVFVIFELVPRVNKPYRDFNENVVQSDFVVGDKSTLSVEKVTNYNTIEFLNVFGLNLFYRPPNLDTCNLQAIYLTFHTK